MRKLQHTFIPTAALLVGGLFGLSHFDANAQTGAAQNGTPTTGASPSATASPSPSPSAFPQTALQQLNSTVAVNLIHHTNQLEIQQSQLALSYLQTPAAQAIAQQLITDHQTADQKLFTVVDALNTANAIAAANTATTTTTTTASTVTSPLYIYGFEQSTFELAAQSALNNLAGTTQFDSAYLQVQLQGHQRALSNLQMTNATVTDPTVQAQITAAIAMVQAHINLLTNAQNGQTASPSPSASASTSTTLS